MQNKQIHRDGKLMSGFQGAGWQGGRNSEWLLSGDGVPFGVMKMCWN